MLHGILIGEPKKNSEGPPKGFVELTNLDCRSVILTFPDGKQLYISTSEWAKVYIKLPT